jgi:dipeptidyl aminopeptidase/acylaminoacyl peptidase
MTAWQRPDPALAAILEAPSLPAASLSPDARLMAFLAREEMPPLEELAQPELRLAGLRVNPRTSNPSRAGHFVGLTFKDLDSLEEFSLDGLPSPLWLRRLLWSPDGRHIALGLTQGDQLSLWIADLDARAARPLGDLWLHELIGSPFSWAPDGQSLLCRLIPPHRGQPPAPPLAPGGPVVEENLGQRRAARTFQDLLTNPHDEDLYEWHARSQLARVHLDGAVELLGDPAITPRASQSPDGQWLLIEHIHRPFSYQLPAGRFPRRLEIWRSDGEFVKVFADLPMADDIPIAHSAVRQGPRSPQWRADAPATLCWVEALDQGDPDVPAAHRDRLFTWAAPFTDDPTRWLDLELRFAGLHWGHDHLAIVHESWWTTRRARAWIAAPADPTAPARLLFDRSWEDRYNDPGSPVLKETPEGRMVLRLSADQRHLFLVGAGASPEGNRPFLDRLRIADGHTERLWRSEAPWFEQPVELLDDDARRLITRRESTEIPPNYFRRDLQTDALEPLTSFAHPSPQLLGSTRELIRYARADGVSLTANLHLPAGYDAGRDGPLPVLLWAYPREFKDAGAASQVRDSPYRFVHVGWSSPLLWLARGWAVLDDPTMPIVGEGDAEPNDSYVEQLVAGARAALEEVARRGVADPARAAIGGHSYGAFMVANLLAHSTLFKAGIARSGAYNRTLTPFGFQAEERTLWQARDTYMAMSPFLYADQIKAPLLLIHGDADNNSGTFPMQSERFYQALKGHGAVARLVMLPHESHAYRARESILHMAWEIDRWLRLHVLGEGE